MREIVLGLIIVVAINLTRCDTCNDCEVLDFETNVEFFFLNGDSLKALSDSLEDNNDSISRLNDGIDTLTIRIADFEDSLSRVLDSIEAGAMDQDYQDIEASLVLLITSDSMLNATFNDNSDSLAAINSILRGLETQLKTGGVLLDTVENQTSGLFITSEDSMSQYDFPLEVSLDPLINVTTYRFHIDNEDFFITLGYDLFESVDVERNIALRAGNIDTLAHTFDSLDIDCANPDCFDNETTITCYY
ncbi:MAG: hypothetical protein KI790_14835 [Cyclobacteriaceae bacterium]|nr:hypothetical protein [Cyclobacteriaceae bacterium HetDA_MAG_MS6]